MKYNVGDKVKIRGDLIVNKKYGGLNFWEGGMFNCRGRVSVIEECRGDTMYKLKNMLYVFSEEMLEPVKEDAKMYCNDFTVKIKGENGKLYKIEECISPFVKIKDYVVVVPGKVVEVLFEEGNTEKMVCQEEDVFDIRRCLFIALAKHLYKKEYTFKGIEYKANEMMYIKRYAKMIDDVLKKHYKGELDAQKKKQQEQEEKERIARRRAKRYAYKERRKHKEEEHLVELQKEAYLRAMREYNEVKADKKKR